MASGTFRPLLARRAAWTLILCGVCQGCIAIPIPHQERAVSESRRMVPDMELELLETRHDLLLRLGEPDLTWQEERVLIYGYATSDLSIFVFAAAGYNASAGAIVVPRYQYLVFQFDEQGRLVRHERRQFRMLESKAAYLARFEQPP